MQISLATAFMPLRKLMMSMGFSPNGLQKSLQVNFHLDELQ